MADGARDHPRASRQPREIAPALEQASGNFDKLSTLTAQRVVRFWQASHNPDGLTIVR